MNTSSCHRRSRGNRVGEHLDDNVKLTKNRRNAQNLKGKDEGEEASGNTPLNISMNGIQGINQSTHKHLPYLMKAMGEVFQEKLDRAIEPLKEEIKQLKKVIEAANFVNSFEKTTSMPGNNAVKNPVWPQVRSKQEVPIIPHIPKISERDQAFNLARRCVGLFPISQEDLVRNTDIIQDCPDQNIKEQLGGAETIRDYLCVIMKMRRTEAAQLNIIRLFKLSGENNTNVLYVEFTNEADLKKIRSLVGNMEKGGEVDPTLVNFIRKVIQHEYDKVAQRAYKGRTMCPKNSSKIWITNRFELRLRPKGDFTPWNKIPEVDPEQEAKPTGAIPKSNTKTKETLSQRPKPNFNNSDNPNFQQVGKERGTKSSWEGPSLLPSQNRDKNIFSMLGEELCGRP